MKPPDSGESRPPLANWRHRLIAFLIDALILFLVYVVVLIAISPVVLAEAWDSSPPATLFTALFWTTVFVLVIWGGLLEGNRGRTPGKAATRLKVVSADDHNQTIGIRKGIVREVPRSIPFLLAFWPFLLAEDMTAEDWLKDKLVIGPAFLLFLTCSLIDHLWLLWDKERRALHDKVSGSYVVSTRPMSS